MKAFFFALFIVMSAGSFCQDSSDNRQVLKDRYLAKRKELKTAGTILEVAAVIGYTVALSTDLNNITFDWTDTNNDPAPNMTWLYIASTAMMIGGVVCYVSATNYKRKAQAISFRFKMDKTEFLQKGLVSSKPLPSLAISIPLK